MCCNLFNAPPGGGPGGGGSPTSPGGPNNSVQFNNGGVFGGDGFFTFDPATQGVLAFKLLTNSFSTAALTVVDDITVSQLFNVIQVDALKAINAVSPLTVTINDTTIPQNQWMNIKDITGICSRAQPIKIVSTSGALIDGVAAKFITAPYGSLTVQWNGSAFFSVPWNSSEVGSQWVTGALDLDLQDVVVDPIIVRLPRGPGFTSDITVFFDAVNMLPYLTITEVGAQARFTFNHTLHNTVDDILMQRTGATFILSAGTNFYFTSDGLINTTTQTYKSFGSFGQLRLWVTGITNNDMPPYQVIINFDSKGKSASFADISIPYSFRSTQHF